MFICRLLCSVVAENDISFQFCARHKQNESVVPCSFVGGPHAFESIYNVQFTTHHTNSCAQYFAKMLARSVQKTLICPMLKS